VLVAREDVAAFAQRAGHHERLGRAGRAFADDRDVMVRAIHGRPNEVVETGIDHDEPVSRALGVVARLFQVLHPADEQAGCRHRIAPGLDFHADGLAYARRRCAVPLVQADINQAPFSVRFDLVGMFDVLEHIPDDLAALKCANSLVKPRGTLLITVPAHKTLWSYADDFAMHCRRYESSELSEKLVSAGFEIGFVSPFMALLYPALRLWRYINGSGSGTSNQQFRRDLTIVPVLNELAALVMSVEARWVATRRHLPFGASLVAVAVKPETP